MCLRWHSWLAAAVLVGTVMSLPAAADVAGSYSCRGTNPNGSVYSGTVAISKNGGGYTMRWKIGGASHSGTGVLSGGQLSASWGVPGGAYGVVVYQVERNGRLVGKWSNPGGGNLGSETLTPR